MSSFGERLRSLRLEHNMTQEELANCFGLHKTRISQYELGKRQADDEMKSKLANYFNVSLDYIMGKSDIKQSAEQILNDSNTTIALHSDETSLDYSELSDEAKKEVQDFIEYVRHKYNK